MSSSIDHYLTLPTADLGMLLVRAGEMVQRATAIGDADKAIDGATTARDIATAILTQYNLEES